MKVLTEEQLKQAADELGISLEEVTQMYQRALQMPKYAAGGMKEALKADTGLAKVAQAIEAGSRPPGHYTKAGRQRAEGRVSSALSEMLAESETSTEEFQQLVAEKGWKQAILSLKMDKVLHTAKPTSKPAKKPKADKPEKDNEDKMLWDRVVSLKRLPTDQRQKALEGMADEEKTALVKFMDNLASHMGLKEAEQQDWMADALAGAANSYATEGEPEAADFLRRLYAAWVNRNKEAEQAKPASVPTPGNWLYNQFTSQGLNPGQQAAPLMTTKEMEEQLQKEQAAQTVYNAFTSARMNGQQTDRRSKTGKPYDAFTSQRLNRK